MLLKLHEPLHITVLKHRTNEKPIVISTKKVEWRPLLYCNQIQVNQELLPIDMTHHGSLGVLQLELDFVPLLSKTEMLTDESVSKHLTLENKFD